MWLYNQFNTYARYSDYVVGICDWSGRPAIWHGNGYNCNSDAGDAVPCEQRSLADGFVCIFHFDGVSMLLDYLSSFARECWLEIYFYDMRIVGF